MTYVVQTTQCPALLPPGSSCTISFAMQTSVAFLISDVTIKGGNTNPTYVNLNAFQCAVAPIITSIGNATFT